MAGTTNFLVFNEANESARTFNDSEYAEATQRLNGVTPGMAISRLHNKLYLQGTAMARAMAEAITANGDDCMDNDIPAITASINKLIDDRAAAVAVFDEYTKTINAPMFNKRDVVTTSGTYTAPVTGWYKITVKGGGGGGQSGLYSTNTWRQAGVGGGEGGTTIGFIRMSAGDTATVVIGAGGTGGAQNTSESGTHGGTGGSSSVTIQGTTLSATGGQELRAGVGTINGSVSTFGNTIPWSTGTIVYGVSGGGAGGGTGGVNASGHDGVNGGGGGGGGHSSGTNFAGGNGGNGYAWFEYFDSSLNP